MTIFLATGLTAGESTPMEDERIETRWFTVREIEEWIDDGKIIDAKTMIGIYRYRRLLSKKRTSR
jgi:ADP-ribose pyrophosphatase